MATVADAPDPEARMRECGFHSEPRPSAVADDPEYEELGWSDAATWWAKDLLLTWKAHEPLYRERVFAWSKKGGRKANPASEEAAIVSIYERPTRTADNSTVGVIAWSGGVVLLTNLTGDWSFPAPSDAKPRTVRGQTGQEWLMGSGDYQMRMTSWTEGGAEWLCLSSPQHWSGEALGQFFEGLAAV